MNFSEYVKENRLVLTNVRVDINQLISFLQENKNITELSLENCYIGDEGAKALANGNLTNLTQLYLVRSNIGDEGVKALANGNLTNLTKFYCSGDNFGTKEAKALAESGEYCEFIDKFVYGDRRKNITGLCRYLKELWSQARKESNSNVSKLDEDTTKGLFFYLARHNYPKESIELFLDDFDKYPFPINSRDEQGRTLSDFYTRDPTMQKFFFERGMIPKEELNQRKDNARTIEDDQSVYDSRIVKRADFIAKKLVEYKEANKEQLEQAVSSYVKSIEQFKQYQGNTTRLKLLDLGDVEKRNVMTTTLKETDPVPSDKQFIETIAEQALGEEYLIKNSYGKYDLGRSVWKVKYGNGAIMTIPEAIGRIKLMIDNLPVPLKEKKNLLIVLMEKEPSLVMKKLSEVKRELGDNVTFDTGQLNIQEVSRLLNSTNDDKKVDNLFKEISDLDIEEVWREQKEFVLLKQIYIAATMYIIMNACTAGIWSYIINSINTINEKIWEQYDLYLEEKQKREAQKDVITEENIKPFLKDLANELIAYVELHPELKDTLEDFGTGIVDIGKPEEITFEQQKILAEINKYFSENIKNVLPNYNRNIPNRDEYYIIITGLSEVAVLQNFVVAGQDLFKLQIGKMETQNDISKIETEEILLKNGAVGDTENTIPHDNVQTNNIKANSVQLNTLGNKSTPTISSQLQTSSQEHVTFFDDKHKQDKQFKLSSLMDSIGDNQSEVSLSESDSEDDKSDITVILKKKEASNQPAERVEQACSIAKESIQPKPVTNEKDSSAKDNSKSKSKGNNATSQNTRSKLPMIAASMLVITGVATGIAIAVYLEMLAVGIAVGACCLVAAAVIYYCNIPSNSLENSGAEAVGNEVQEVG